MDYPVTTSRQLQTVLRALRQTQGLSQTQAGLRLGVSQKRIARIEAKPGVTGFDQIARLVSALGGRLVISTPDERPKPGIPAKGAARANSW
jgi:HTH-type transcriptional regulator/antitoxin HipB